MAKSRAKKPPFVNDVEATNETLTSRAGINLFVRYLRESHIIQIFDRFFPALSDFNLNIAEIAFNFSMLSLSASAPIGCRSHQGVKP